MTELYSEGSHLRTIARHMSTYKSEMLLPHLTELIATRRKTVANVVEGW